MEITLLKAKLHQATVTHSELHYEGSCAIDSDLLDATGMLEYEKIEIYNITNGKRFATYIIRGEAGSGVISVNGAAAHQADPGDCVIICAYVGMPVHEAPLYKPVLVYLDINNQIRRTANTIPVQTA